MTEREQEHEAALDELAREIERGRSYASDDVAARYMRWLAALQAVRQAAREGEQAVMAAVPQRIQLLRRKGFDLQAVSHALNLRKESQHRESLAALRARLDRWPVGAASWEEQRDQLAALDALMAEAEQAKRDAVECADMALRQAAWLKDHVSPRLCERVLGYQRGLSAAPDERGKDGKNG